MRPKRTRGIRKRYTEDQFALDDDDEPISISNEQSGDEDFDAQADAHQAPDDDDLEDADPTSDDDDGNQSDGATEDGAAQQPNKKVRNLGAGMIQSRKGVHDIPNYPLETRIVTRVYAGPLRRYARYSALRDCMYGPEYHRIKIIWDLDNRWREYSLLPPKLSPLSPKGITPSPWVRPGFEKAQEHGASEWYREFGVHYSDFQQSHLIDPGRAQGLMPQAKGGIIAMVGPWDRQSELGLNPREGCTVSATGAPIEDSRDSGEANGWMVDTGGIPLALAWAPSSRRDIQILAVASVPFQDQELVPQTSTPPEEQPDTTGCIQFWGFLGQKPEGELASPTRCQPKLLAVQLFDWGRPKRMQWCPVPIDSAGIVGLLAVLCGDGRARIIQVKNIDDVPDTQYERFKEPIATFGTAHDYNVSVTCLAWINTNRIALGHSDGSVTLWSIFPQKLLQRFGVHSNYVIDICSGYPSNPYMVATIPVGGCATLTDLTQPSSEATYFPVPAISFQPNMLCWNEFMQGFMALYPSSTPTTTVAFLHHRFFCQARSTITGPNSITCVSAGTTHPFVLVGSADGSVYGCNALQKLFKQKGEPLQKIKVFEHEYRPIERDPEDEVSSPRGAVRILRGWLPELNDDPRTEKRKEVDRKKRLANKKKMKGKKCVDDDPDDRVDEINNRLASRAITHEPLTRITVIEWNPNLPFSCWAACAMGSGLVQVLDLGVS